MDQSLLNMAQEAGAKSQSDGTILFGMTEWGIIAALFFSLVGTGYMWSGKKNGSIVVLLCGLGMIIFPYFVTSTLPMVLIGIALAALPFFVKA